MFKKLLLTIPLTMSLFLLHGCGPIGNKNTSMAAIYLATTLFSLLLLVGYCAIIKKKNIWFLLLFSSVLIVNLGYLSLSVSKTLEEALLANRISYLGSVFLPMSMLLIIMNVSKVQYKKWIPGFLLTISIVVFIIAASPGYLDIYYKDVSIIMVNGVAVLKKVYGPLHSTYLYYLATYFGVMIMVILQASRRKVLDSSIHSLVLLAAVFVNIAVWLLEQLVSIDFEFLSVSYIITELFLLFLFLIMEEDEKRYLMYNHEKEVAYTQILESNAPNCTTTVFPEVYDESEKNAITSMHVNAEPNAFDIISNDNKLHACKEPQAITLSKECIYLMASLPDLTHTERLIYDYYLEGKTTKEILRELNIKENTLKFHNKNIYSKLGVTSRKQLIKIAKEIKLAQEMEAFTK